ncbi:MAG: ribonuclease III [Cyclobacteriaceae bacterium]
MTGIVSKWLTKILHFYSRSDRNLADSLYTITGNWPGNLQLYKLAMRHTSVAEENDKGIKESNERLEYLGDAILGAVVAEYLFCKYPYKSEGFLTEIRSRLVNRETMNRLSKKIGLASMVQYDNSSRGSISPKSLFGDTLEALIGAVFLDKNFKTCRKFIIKKLIIPHFDIEEIIENNPNFKSKIIEWAQKSNRDLRFEIVGIKEENNTKRFTAQVMLEEEPLGTGYGLSKKKAEQDAAQKSCELLNLN